MQINQNYRKKLEYYLKEFYKRYRHEKFTVFHFVKYVKARIKLNKDLWLAVCGNTSTGKSYGDLLMMILSGKRMNLKTNVCYDPDGDEVSQKFSKLRKGVLMIDEAARDFRAIGWQSKTQQKVTMQALTDRFYNNIVLLNLPNFKELNKSMREGTVLFRLIYLYRTDKYARVVVQARSRNWRSDDPWKDKEADELYVKFEKKHGSPSNEDVLKMERSLSTYIMDFAIPNLALILPEVTEEYERLKLESRENAKVEEKKKSKEGKKLLKLTQEKEDALIRFAHLLEHNNPGLGLLKISKQKKADIMGISLQTYNKLLKKEPSLTVKEIEKDKPHYLKTSTESVRPVPAEPVSDPPVPDESSGIFDKKKDPGYVPKEYTL